MLFKITRTTGDYDPELDFSDLCDNYTGNLKEDFPNYIKFNNLVELIEFRETLNFGESLIIGKNSIEILDVEYY